MKCACVFFAGLTGISLPKTVGPGWPIRGPLKVTTDRSYVHRLIGSYSDGLGTLETSFLTDTAKAVAFFRETLEIDSQRVPEAANGIIIKYLEEVQLWLSGLWLIRDNSVNVDVAWMAVHLKEKEIINNNRWSTSVCMADGTYSETPYSTEELKWILGTPFHAATWSQGSPIALGWTENSDPLSTKLSAKSLRYQRFLYFVHAARSARDIAIKIAHYCSGLEVLVSSSQTELSHQVAERVSCILHPLGAKRLSTFKLIKAAYGIRSKAVHGATFKEKEEAVLKRTSIDIDDICRDLALLYLEQDQFREAIESGSQAFNEFWLSRTFLEFHSG